MCFHRRLVFSCSHHAWLGVTQPCSVEKAFDRGEADTGCGARWSHGFDTVRVQQQCAGCVQARAGAEYRFGVVREQLRVIREHLELIKGVTVGEQGEDGKGEGEAEKEKKDGEREEGESSVGCDSPGHGGSAVIAASSCSSGAGSEGTGETSLEEGLEGSELRRDYET